MSKPHQPPSCPRCTRQMLVVLTVPAFAGHAGIESYACRPCLEVVTMEGQPIAVPAK